MVNGIADSSQRGKVAVSVASLAASAGLPRILVDLRHEATHNDLPSMPSLRLAVHQALGWLRTNYWLRQSEQLETSKGRITSLVQEYISLHLAAAFKVFASSSAQAKDDGDEDDQPAEGSAPAAVPAGGYSAASARRQRQAVFTELRTLVPQPAAWLLVEGLLLAERSATADVGRDTACAAFRNALNHLTQEWPQLQVLVLERLAKEQDLTDTSAAIDTDSRPLDVWSGVLLGAAGTDAALPLSQEQIVHLIELIVAGHGSERSPALVTFGKALAERVNSSAVRAQLEATLACLAPDAAHEERPTGDAPPFPAVGAEGRSLEAALQAEFDDLERAQAQFAAAVVGIGRPAGKRLRSEQEEGAVQPDGGAKRWKRVQNWQACALGTLPSLIDPNGRLPELDGAAIAVATEAGEGGVDGPSLPRGPHENGATLEEGRRPSVVGNQALNGGDADGRWPPQDRFTGGMGGDGAAVGPGQGAGGGLQCGPPPVVVPLL